MAIPIRTFNPVRNLNPYQQSAARGYVSALSSGNFGSLGVPGGVPMPTGIQSHSAQTVVSHSAIPVSILTKAGSIDINSGLPSPSAPMFTPSGPSVVQPVAVGIMPNARTVAVTGPAGHGAMAVPTHGAIPVVSKPVNMAVPIPHPPQAQPIPPRYGGNPRGGTPMPRTISLAPPVPPYGAMPTGPGGYVYPVDQPASYNYQTPASIPTQPALAIPTVQPIGPPSVPQGFPDVQVAPQPVANTFLPDSTGMVAPTADQLVVSTTASLITPAPSAIPLSLLQHPAVKTGAKVAAGAAGAYVLLKLLAFI